MENGIVQNDGRPADEIDRGDTFIAIFAIHQKKPVVTRITGLMHKCTILESYGCAPSLGANDQFRAAPDTLRRRGADAATPHEGNQRPRLGLR